MIHATNISFSYGTDYIYHHANFTVGFGQKVGLVGPNGAGKSTLFSLLTKDLELDEGHIQIAGELGYVPQEVVHDEYLLKARSIQHYIDPSARKEVHELKQLLGGLELSHIALERTPGNLSGGQKTKLALARALIAEPDTLLLDEPVNFMDRAGKRYVMDFLSRYPKSLLIVSHDLDLLDQDIDKILAVNKQTKQIDTYAGTYKEAMKRKKEQEEFLRREITAKQKHIVQMEKAMEKLYKYTSKKGVRARVQLSKRIEREKAVLPDMPSTIQSFSLKLPSLSRINELPIVVRNVSKSYGAKRVLTDVTFAVKRGELFLIEGVNGAGKSTLIKIIMGKLATDSGTIEIGDKARIGYYSQEFETFDLSKSIIDTVTGTCRIDEENARHFLGRFMFDADNIHQSVKTLSGGEKTRLAIAMLMAVPHNLLILDEPTTYLDPLSQRIVLEALKEYKGTIVLVSHVAQFVYELSPSRVLRLPEERVVLLNQR